MNSPFSNPFSPSQRERLTQDVQYMRTFEMMNANNKALQQQTLLSPEQQEELNTTVQQYKIQGISVPEFN